MNLPKGITEADFLAAIDKANALLARSFKFGPHEVADIKQQAALFACEAMASGKYDCSRPLANFLYAHIRNRLINFRRDKFRRNDPPCRACHQAAPGESPHPGGEHCERYTSWLRRNATKQSLMCPLGLSHISDEHEPNTREESSAEADVEQQELLRLIDQKLPLELRSAYLRMRDGCHVPKAVREEVEGVVRSILHHE